MIHLNIIKVRAQRNAHGSMAALFPAVILIAVVGIGAFAMDISHNVTVRSELQSSTDAAALSGAQDFKTAATWNNVENDALSVAANNIADGKAVSNTSPNTSVVVTSQAPANGDPGWCKVDASTQISNMFAKLFQHRVDPINTTSTANYWDSVNAIDGNQMFPIAPSLDDTSSGPALNTLHLGDPITINIQPSGGNAAWTNGTTNMVNPSTPVIRAAVDASLGLAPFTATSNPPMVADGINQIALTQGLHNGVDLSDAPYPALMAAKPFLVMPVMGGSKPYNQSRVLLGFIAVKVSSVTKSAGALTVQGTLVKGLVRGTGGLLPAAGNSITALSPGTVKLVQ